MPTCKCTVDEVRWSINRSLDRQTYICHTASALPEKISQDRLSRHCQTVAMSDRLALRMADCTAKPERKIVWTADCFYTARMQKCQTKHALTDGWNEVKRSMHHSLDRLTELHLSYCVYIAKENLQGQTAVKQSMF